MTKATGWSTMSASEQARHAGAPLCARGHGRAHRFGVRSRRHSSTSCADSAMHLPLHFNVLMCDGLRIKVLVLTTPSHASTHHRQRASMQPTAPVAALVRRTRGWMGYRSTVPRRCCNQSHRWAPGKTWTSVRCQRMRCNTLFSSICDAVLKTYDPWVCTRLSSGAWVKINSAGLSRSVLYNRIAGPCKDVPNCEPRAGYRGNGNDMNPTAIVSPTDVRCISVSLSIARLFSSLFWCDLRRQSTHTHTHTHARTHFRFGCWWCINGLHMRNVDVHGQSYHWPSTALAFNPVTRRRDLSTCCGGR